MAAGILSGFFAMFGVVYCSWPFTPLIHFAGTVGLGELDFSQPSKYVSSERFPLSYTSGFWFASSSTSVILAINRCIVMLDPALGQLLFDGKMAYVWLAFPTLYIVVACLFYKPLLYTSKYVGWYANPHIGYHDELAPKVCVITTHTAGKMERFQYYNVPHMTHNMAVLVILTVLYATFFIVLCKRYSQMGGQRQFKKEISVSLQFAIRTSFMMS